MDIPDRRDEGLSGQVRRWAWRYAWHLLFGVAAVAVASGWSVLRGVFAAPGKLAQLIPQVATIEAEQAAMKVEVKEASEAAWVLVTFECLKLPAGDSVFTRTRLQCGRAYERSGFNDWVRR